MAVDKGSKVKVEYEGKFDDGTVFDSTAKHDNVPLEFEVGKGNVIRGFEEAVMGMEKGEEKEISVDPKKGYGDRDPGRLKKISKDKLPQGNELKAGMMIALQAPNGMQVPGKIASVDVDSVMLDLNHPLAGRTLHFKIKVVDVA